MLTKLPIKKHPKGRPANGEGKRTPMVPYPIYPTGNQLLLLSTIAKQHDVGRSDVFRFVTDWFIESSVLLSAHEMLRLNDVLSAQEDGNVCTTCTIRPDQKVAFKEYSQELHISQSVVVRYMLDRFQFSYLVGDI